MAATHCVSLFLPNTIEWVDTPAEQPRACETPMTTVRHMQTRSHSYIELPKRASQLSLLPTLTPPLTTYSADGVSLLSQATTDVFGHAGELRDTHQHYFATPGNPRSLLRSDAEVLEWGQERRFNQPRSRAGPLPSQSILDFSKFFEEQEKQRERQLIAVQKKPKPASSLRSSRNTSHDRAYEGKSWVVQPALQGNGGLINAVRAGVDAGGMEVSWVGTLGFPTDALPPSTKEEIADHLSNEYQSDVVYVCDKDMDGHYANYCKIILWPIFHYQVPDHPKSKAYADHSWQFYRRTNQAFADKVVGSYKRGDTVWVHDYHLLLVPGMIRKQLPDAQIGFFLHTAFPSSEIFRCLSTRKELLEGMLGANLVAFQTDEYAQHFLQTCSRLLTVETTSEGVQLDKHFVNVTYQPIGINAQAIEEVRESQEVKDWIAKLRDRIKNRKMIVARDKFDNTHGIRQKLLAFELFLKKFPEWDDEVVLLQVATSTSAQSELLTTVSDICARIDWNHHNLEKQSLIFLKQDISFPQYLALLSAADVLMVSSLRDGMNLTAHEYIYCQDGAIFDKKHGPLILSEFTGSASMFGSGHISINPWDYHNQADSIKYALEMSAAEKKIRWTKLHQVVQTYTGERWARALGQTLSKVHDDQSQRSVSSVPRLSNVQISEKYRDAAKRLFIIDYEGTLAPHRTKSGMPLMSPYRIVDTLNDLMSDSKNLVYVTSGRTQSELESIFRLATGVGLVAENGGFIREAGTSTHAWFSLVDLVEVQKWKFDVRTVLQYYEDRMEGSFIEERRCSLIFRYDKVEDQDMANRLAGDCADQINSSCKSLGLRAVPVAKALVVELEMLTKGTAARQIFDRLSQPVSVGSKMEISKVKIPTFLMVAGDDREDEVVFRWANHLAHDGAVRDVFTVSVGKRNTEAQATLTQGPSGLLAVLQKLGKISLETIPLDYLTSPRKAAKAC